MINKTYNQKCDVARLQKEIITAGLAIYPNSGYVFYSCTLDQLNDDSWVTTVVCNDNISSGEKADIDAVVAIHVATPLPTIEAPLDSDNRPYVRAESRPLGYNTNFTCRGDTNEEIGGGNHLMWNFNNTDNDVVSPPTGYKQKLITTTFIDPIRLKEGTVYWLNMPFGSYGELYMAVPDWGNTPYLGWYMKNNGSLAQNKTGSPLKIHSFANTPLMGDCPMGDELNTEAASEQDIPAGTIMSVLVTVPDSVTNTDDCCGAVQVELYRIRTVILS